MENLISEISNYGVLGLWTASLLWRNLKLENLLKELSENIRKLNEEFLKINLKF